MQKAEQVLTMDGGGEPFEVKGKTYTVYPLLYGHVKEFLKDNLSVGEPFFNFVSDADEKKVNKWLGEVTVKINGREVSNTYCMDETGEPMTLEKAAIDRWDLSDFKRYLRILCSLSG